MDVSLRAPLSVAQPERATISIQESIVACRFAALHDGTDARCFGHSAFAERCSELRSFNVKFYPTLEKRRVWFLRPSQTAKGWFDSGHPTSFDALWLSIYPVWKGTVEVFSVSNPPPERAYGWAVEGDYVAVLGNPPVDSPIAAVRAWLVSENKKK